MLDEVFMSVLDMSKTGSIVILAVLLVRLLLKRAPKVFSYALWAVVLLRLLCPFSIQSDLSILPEMKSVSDSYTLSDTPISVAGASLAAYQAVGDAVNGGLGVQHIYTTQRDDTGFPVVVSASWNEVWILFGQYVWVAGIAVLVIYSLVSLVKLRSKLCGAVLLRDNIYIADHITSPFVMGLIRPKIYLPSSLPEAQQGHITAHEQYHIYRLDHIVKFLSFLTLCVHWFNPLVWVAFILSGQDMEMSCDEAVLKKLGPDIRADYSASLLNLATGHRIIAGAPLAFGEGDTKGRIRNMANWKKPKLWLCILAVAVIIICIVVLLTNPAGSTDATLWGSIYSVEEVLYAKNENFEVYFERFRLDASYILSYQTIHDDAFRDGGHMEQISSDTLQTYIQSYLPGSTKRVLKNVADAYILHLPDDYFIIAAQTKDDETIFAYGWEDVGERNDSASDDTEIKAVYRVETEFQENQIHAGYFDDSLCRILRRVPVCLSYTNAPESPGYLVVGFRFHEGSDAGFAVFQTNGTGYRLLSCYSYENALDENGIFCCPDPAVLDAGGTITNENTYDVVLLADSRADAIERVYYKRGVADKSVRSVNFASDDTVLFRWADNQGYAECDQTFYDPEGNVLLTDTFLPNTAALVTEVPTPMGAFRVTAVTESGTQEAGLPTFTHVTGMSSACGISPYLGTYGDENTLVFQAGTSDRIILSATDFTEAHYDIRFRDSSYYDRGDQYTEMEGHGGAISFAGDPRKIILSVPTEPGEYIYSIHVIWADESVICGLKVIVE